MSNYFKKLLLTLLILSIPYMNSASKAMDSDEKSEFKGPKIFKALLSNKKEHQWVPHGCSRKVLEFDSVEGNIESDSLSTFIIPENGMYSLRVRCCWRSVHDYADFQTAIAIDTMDDTSGLKNLHIIGQHQLIDELNLNTHLIKGQKVMISIYGHPNVQYGTGPFKFYIEKIN